MTEGALILTCSMVNFGFGGGNERLEMRAATVIKDNGNDVTQEHVLSLDGGDNSYCSEGDAA